MSDPNLHPAMQEALSPFIPAADADDFQTMTIKLCGSDRAALAKIMERTGETENMAIQSAISWLASVERESWPRVS